jgi:photosystem II stability/assembly factor-like uncharacterized protein
LSWEEIFDGNLENFAFSPNDLNKIFVAGQTGSGSNLVAAIYSSSDGGKNWTSHRLTTTVGKIKAVTVDPKSDNILYAGGVDVQSGKSILFKSLNAGNSWTKIGGNISSKAKDIRDIAIDPVSPSHVYVATNTGIFKSVDSGSSWEKTSLSTSVNCVKVYPNSPKIVVAAGKDGIYYSNDRGDNWTEANNGLTVYNVNCVDWDLKKEVIYAGTEGGSVYKNKKLLKKIK